MGQNNLGDRGTTRGGGTPVKVIVKSDGVAVPGISVSAKGVDGNAVLQTTGADGVAAFTLPAGHYTVSAVGDSGSASKSLSVVESTSTEIVGLALSHTAS